MFERLKTPLVAISLLICFLHQTESRYLDSWHKVENFTHQNVINLVHKYGADFTSIIDSSDVSNECRSSLIDYKNGLLNFELTAVKRLDSSGKLPSGVLAGTFTDLGSFDSCVSLESSQYCLLYTNVPLFNETGYEGFMRPYEDKLFNFTTEPLAYFAKYIHFLRRMNITTGLCVPDNCSREELKFIVGRFFDRHNTGLTADVDLCYSRPETVTWRPSEAIGLAIIVLIIFLNLIGSWSSEDSLLSSFNWSANRRKFFTIDNSPIYESLSFLDGIKVFTMFLVVLSHFQMGNMYNLYKESFRFIEIVTNPAFIPVYLAPYTVDLFLMVTGVLMGFYFFSGNRRLNLLSFVVGRWARFAALMGWIICLQFIFFSEHFRFYFGGPFWSDYSAVGSIVKSCEKTWFTTLLLSQFWFDNSNDANVCLLYDWYLAADFMLSMMFLLVLIPYLRNYRKTAVFISIVLITIGLLFSGLGIHFLGIPTTWIASNFQRMPLIQYSFDYNLKPWPHMGPYFVGVTFGFIASYPKLKLSKISMILGWIMCFACLSSNFVYEYIVNRFGIDPDYSIALTYGILSKTVWATGWAWIVLMLKLGHFRSISTFLSHRIFRLLSKINLSVLCTNLLIIRLHSGSSRTLVYPAYIDALLYHYLPLYLIIYALALLSTLMVEFPIVNLLRKMFNNQSGQSKTKTKNDQSPGEENITLSERAITRIVISSDNS